MSKFVSNKLAKKINSVAADLCVYRTQNFGACQDAAYTKIIDRLVATITGIDVTRDVMWGSAAAPSIVYPCRVQTGYTASQAALAHAVLNGLAGLHSRIGQRRFNTTLFELKFLTRDLGWQQELAERKANWLAEIAELNAEIAAGEQKLAERTAEYRRCPNRENEWRMSCAAADVRGDKYRRAHIEEALAAIPTPETVVAKLRNELVAEGILPA